MVNVDLAGGVDPRHEYAIDQPAEPIVNDAVAAWIYDDHGQMGFPRIHLERRGDDWDNVYFQVSVAFADGRIVDGSGSAPARFGEDADGHRSVFGGGPLEFRCIVPFRRWRVTFDGSAVDTTSDAQRDQVVDRDVTTQLSFALDLETVTPPWIRGRGSGGDVSPSDGGGKTATPQYIDSQGVGYEQFVRATGRVRCGGDERRFSGSGIRLRRFGPRDLTQVPDVHWQSAIFPSGRAFKTWSVAHGPPYEESYVRDGDQIVPARVSDITWITDLPASSGEDVSFVLETESGRHDITGQTIYSYFIPAGAELPTEGYFPVGFQHGGVRLSWDGEEGFGLLARVHRGSPR